MHQRCVRQAKTPCCAVKCQLQRASSAYLTQLSSRVHRPSSWQSKDLARSSPLMYDILAFDAFAFDKQQSVLQVREEPPWQQLATATHVAQQTPQDPAIAKPHIEAWDQALHNNELQLLQLHIAATLQKPCELYTLSCILSWTLCCVASLCHGMSWHVCPPNTNSEPAVEPVKGMLATVYSQWLCCW